MYIQKIVELQNQFLLKIEEQAYQTYSIQSKANSSEAWNSYEQCVGMEQEQEKKQSSYHLPFLDKFLPAESSFYSNLANRLEKVNINFIPLNDVKTRFCRQKENQKKNYQKRMAQISSIIEQTVEIPNDFRQLQLNNLTLTRSDLQSLKPQKYLNGDCIFFYMKLVVDNIIDQNLKKDVFLYNTYFMTKLLGSYISQIDKYESVKQTTNKQFIKQIKSNAPRLLRWTKNTNIFEKKYLIFPINLPGHWIAVMVYDLPNFIKNKSSASILYMDSLYKKSACISEAIRIYLQLQLEAKRNQITTDIVQITKQNLPDYQLLLPRQPNFHDCGPCSLLNVESILLNPHILNVDFSNPPLRKLFIELYPKTLIYTMRSRILNLLIKLFQSKGNVQINKNLFKQYLHKRQQLINQKDDTLDYDCIDEKQFKKYLAIKRCRNGTQQQQFAALVQFYIDPNTNYFENK